MSKHSKIRKILNTMIKAFPNCYVDEHYTDRVMFNFDNDIATALVCIHDDYPVEQIYARILESICAYCYPSRVYNKSLYGDRNLDLIAGTNKVLGTNFTQEEFRMIDIIMGGHFNTETTMKFVNMNFDKEWLHKKFSLLEAYLNF